jgi:peptidoglycan hydrolase-like protein with peptidoglycan-binding domain
LAGSVLALAAPMLAGTAHAAEPELRVGDTGTAVKTLERALAQLGYYHGAIDGIFGAEVEAAVIAFQSRHHIEASGIVGPVTWQALSTALNQPLGAAPHAGPSGLLREGDQGPAVTHLQELLRAVGAPVTVDGIFGPDTKAAVVAFQESEGIPASGVVGSVTLRLLETAASQAALDLSLGSTGPAVRILQRQLTALGYNVGGIDGIFGAATQAAVEAFQRAEGLPVTGVVGPTVEAALLRALETSRGMTANASLAAAIVGFAQTLIGSPYEWGGNSPSTGFDCSGFVQYVFAHFGIDLPRTSYAQFDVGTHIAYDQLQPGDLVFFSTDGPGASHVGLWVGGGYFIAADNYATGVRLNAMDSYWLSHFVGGTIPPGLS